MLNEKQLRNVLFFAVLLFISFCTMALLVKDQRLYGFDHTIIHFIQGFESQRLTVVMKFFTKIGSFPSIMAVFLLVLLILGVYKSKVKMLIFGAVVLATPLINEMLKLLFQRVRPNLHRLIEIGGYSFPSGHSMNAVSLYGVLVYLLWNHVPGKVGRTVLIIISALFIFMIGISRIYLGVHYPSDVIAGYLASSFWLCAAIWFFHKYVRRT
ncbi:phosphatase PAP2 family protein [Siminovitchia fortis]|uniref:Phosphatase PAP2 family protein n=1 Tax=Siminovitchia fortis TaxID=254758 RepID=A0A443IPY7_9BACI|nr:phosphatase PAP2 family protein [Siminovitchia fortis]RWR08638.1 phosphatase PAP2 family protein [Siminovitchia fortis]WHY83118.1 phosphatase PAP2 family protein [Siminovitchia fortis]